MPVPVLAALIIAICCATGHCTEPAKALQVTAFDLPDLTGKSHTIEDWKTAKLVVVVQLGTECPVANSYLPGLNRSLEMWKKQGIVLIGVHSDPTVTLEDARVHAREMQIGFPVLMDPRQVLARQTGATTISEATLLSSDGTVCYRGRINDRYSTTGKRKEMAQVHDLQNAITTVLAGQPVTPPTTKAFGCPLPKLTADKPR